VSWQPAEDAALLGGQWKLPRGPHGLPREMVVDHQRQRMLSGVAAALAEHGYAQMTVEHVLAHAGVSRTTFYEHFDNRRECVLIAHEQVFNRLTGELVAACAAEAEWPAKVTAGVHVAIEFATETPEEAHLLVLDAVAAEPELVTQVLASSDFLVGLLRNGREQCPQAAALPELTERALIGATASVIGTRLLSGQADQLRDLEPQLVQLLLMPYVGTEEARRIAEAGR
jgi:AcrR family transcriptional regulator